jgi:hypothetical protein
MAECGGLESGRERQRKKGANRLETFFPSSSFTLVETHLSLSDQLEKNRDSNGFW